MDLMSLYDGKRKSDHDDDSDDDDGFPLPSKQDYQAADAINASLCYGEIKPDGVNFFMEKILQCNQKHVRNMVDLGAGYGRLALQVFLEYPNIKKVTGIELAPSRSIAARRAVTKLGQNTIAVPGMEDHYFALVQKSETERSEKKQVKRESKERNKAKDALSHSTGSGEKDGGNDDGGDGDGDGNGDGDDDGSGDACANTEKKETQTSASMGKAVRLVMKKKKKSSKRKATKNTNKKKMGKKESKYRMQMSDNDNDNDDMDDDDDGDGDGYDDGDDRGDNDCMHSLGVHARERKNNDTRSAAGNAGDSSELTGRALEMIEGNLFDVDKQSLREADLVILQTKIRRSSFADLIALFKHLKDGVKILSYEDLRMVYRSEKVDFPFSNIKYTSEYTRAQLRKKKRKKNKKRKSEDEETNSSVVQGVCDVDGDAEEYVHTHYLNIDPISVTWSANGHHFQYLEKV